MKAAFTGAPPPSGYFDPTLISDKLKQIFLGNGFIINKSKAHYSDQFARKIVTGLKIHDKVNVDRKYVRNIRAALFAIETNGIDASQKKFEDFYGGRTDLKTYLQGKISWVGHIKGLSDSTFRTTATRFNKLFSPAVIKYDPSIEDIRDYAVWIVDNFENCIQGSGFFLKDVGFVTAAHCIETASEVSLTHPQNPKKMSLATIKFIDTNVDLAILNHNVEQKEYFELEALKAPPYKGEEVSAAGYPSFGTGDILNIREGKVIMTTHKHGIKLLEVSQKLSQGMSGGPILNKSGQVVGIIHKGGPAEGRDFAIDISVLHSMLASI